METVFATAAGVGAANEDYAVCGPSWAVILDGATAPKGVDSGCIHDVPWLVRHLAQAMTAELMIGGSLSLADILAVAIVRTCHAHADTCDLDNLDSPSSTVAMIRERGGELEYLVLGDSPVILRSGEKIQAVQDNRTDFLPGGRPYSVELVREWRNKPGGFWVASTNVQAAYEAVSGSTTEVTDVAMVTDGITRLLDWYGDTWHDVFGILHHRGGPAELIRRVRDAERGGVPFGKQHDDATVIYASGIFQSADESVTPDPHIMVR